jgi:phosphoesterase RecJ-like protein
MNYEIHDKTISAIHQCIQNSDRIALFCHIRPDGDTIGSVLGLGWALQAAGKEVQFISQDDIPSQDRLRFEDYVDTSPFQKTPGLFDCSILLDISDIQRAGDYFSKNGTCIPDICIDHHPSNIGIARINWIDSEKAATAVIIAKLIPLLGLSFNKKTASALLSGILTDTQGFTTRNTDSETLQIASEMIQHGADLYEITQSVMMAHSFEAGKYWSFGLAKMQRDGKLLWSVLKSEDKEKSGYPGNDDANLINYLSTTEAIQIALLFVEQSPQSVKISWRGRPGVDVASIAKKFGGGGHVLAAGATINQSFESIFQEVLNETKKAIA